MSVLDVAAVLTDASGKVLSRNAQATCLPGAQLPPTASENSQGRELHQGFFPRDGETPFPVEDLPIARALRGDSVMHNIGNAISSVSVRLGTLGEMAQADSRLRHLMTLEQALRSNETDLANYLLNDPQGRKVVPFLSALVRDFAALSARRTRSTERVSRAVNQIVDAIRAQGTSIRCRYI